MNVAASFIRLKKIARVVNGQLSGTRSNRMQRYFCAPLSVNFSDGVGLRGIIDKIPHKQILRLRAGSHQKNSPGADRCAECMACSPME